MIKQTIYTNPDNGNIWCVTLENGKEFICTYDPEQIDLTMTDDWRESIKESSGENIAVIRVSEAEN